MKFAQKLALNYYRAKLNILALLSPRKAAIKAFNLFCTPLRKSKKKIPPVFDLAQKLEFKLNGKLIKGYGWNRGEPQKALIIHGFESSSRNFDRFVQPLIKKGYEVLAFDAPAHGRSEGKKIHLPLYIQTLEKIVSLYGPVNIFIAHSFGGLALAHMLEKIPHTEQTKAVLLAPATETITFVDQFFEFLNLSPAIREEFNLLIEEVGGVPVTHYSILRAMQQIKAKIIWFHDTTDELTPYSDAIKVRDAGFANLEFITTVGLGHRGIYRDDNVVKKLLEFC